MLFLGAAQGPFVRIKEDCNMFSMVFLNLNIIPLDKFAIPIKVENFDTST